MTFQMIFWGKLMLTDSYIEHLPYIIVVAVHSQDNMRLACANAVLAVYLLEISTCMIYNNATLIIEHCINTS